MLYARLFCRRAANALIIIVLAACSRGDTTSGNIWAGERQVVDGILVVKNPAEPLLSPTQATVARLWEVTSDRSQQGAWERPVQVRHHDGVVYVLDRMASKVYLISPDGEWTDTWGRKGSGPGEFVDPYAIDGFGNNVFVADAGKASVDVLDMAGMLQHSIKLGAISFDMHAITSGSLLVNTFVGRDGGWRIYSPDGSSVTFSPQQHYRLREELHGDCWRTAAAGNIVIQISCTRPILRELDLTGTVMRVVEIDRDHQEASPEELRTLERSIKANLVEAGIPPGQARSSLAVSLERVRVKRAMRKVRYDSAAKAYIIWEQEPDEFGGGNAVLHLISTSGEYMAKVVLPAPLVDLDSNGLTIYGLEEQEATGLVNLAAYRVELPAVTGGGMRE